jgi:hypothetical protein
MAEEQVEPRTLSWRQLFPWTELFRGFQVALDPKKLLLAAAGILLMAAWWWVCSLAFYSPRSRPEWPKDYPLANYKKDNEDDKKAYERAWAAFKEDREKWNLLHEAAGTKIDRTDAGDLAQKLDYFEPIKNKIEVEKLEKFELTFADGTTHTYEVKVKPYGRLAIWPFFENRGPNPVLLVAGKAGYQDDSGTIHPVPWEKGQFPSWFLSNQVPVLIEPLIKFMRPLYYMILHPPVGFWNAVYFTLILLGNLVIWALFGGAITRMAAVQIARKEKIGMTEALRFTRARWISFFSAPLFPLLFVLLLAFLMILFGFVHLIPWLGDVFDGIFWFLPTGAAVVMAVVLVGLVGWPMMYATISTEGSDSFDALSRSYSYVYQSPWNYVWYALVSVGYGMILVFFVGFMGSLTVYLAKWGVSQTPFVKMADREPSYLFVYAPTSYQWRDLLLQDSPAENNRVLDLKAYDEYCNSLNLFNKVGAALVAAWLYLIFLLILGFGYSYFWSASTIIYLLMRRKVDDTELDEVYLEEEEPDQAYSPPAPEGSEPSGEHTPAVTMVEPPSFKTPDSAQHSAGGEHASPAQSDGNRPESSGSMESASH